MVLRAKMLWWCSCVFDERHGFGSNYTFGYSLPERTCALFLKAETFTGPQADAVEKVSEGKWCSERQSYYKQCATLHNQINKHHPATWRLPF